METCVLTGLLKYIEICENTDLIYVEIPDIDWRKKLSKLLVQKSGPLKGSVKVKGAKNSVLKLLAASILADEPCTIESVPELLDVEVMITLLESLGLEIEYDKENHSW